MTVNPALRPAERLLNASMLLHAAYLLAMLANHLLLAQAFFPEGVSALSFAPLAQIGYAFLRVLIHYILYSKLKQMTRQDYTGEAGMTAALAAYFILDFICGILAGIFQSMMTNPKLASFGGGGIGEIVYAVSMSSSITSFAGILLSASIVLLFTGYGVIRFYFYSLEKRQ